MHELTRRAYLESMGVDTYVSRRQLPGAGPTRRLAIVRREKESREAPRANSASVRPSLGAVFETGAAAKTRRERPTPAERPATTSIPSFSIAAIACGGWLWLEELREAPLSRDQVHLVRAIARALGLPEGQPQVSQFDWPIHRNTQLDLGDEAANMALAGFVQRKAEQHSCAGIVVLGADCMARLESDAWSGTDCTATHSTADMMRDPGLKKQVWQDLSRLPQCP